MKIFLTLLLVLGSSLHADSCLSKLIFRGSPLPRARSASVPQSRVSGLDTDYLTGYVQALVDMSYYEFKVRVLVEEGVVYVFNLPRNDLIAESIISFIYDIPCICCVQRIDCSCEEFISCVQEQSPDRAEALAASAAYESICIDCCQEPTVGGVWFPTNTLLFQPLFADPRQVINAASIRWNDDVIGNHVGGVVFGNDFIFFRWLDVLRWRGDADIGIEAGVFSVFDLDHIESAMVNSDFYVALLMTYAVNKWAWRLRIWHMSSHIGDEFLLANPGFDRKNVSDNGFDIFASWYPVPAVRLYLGLGDILWRDKEFYTKPFYFEWGTEIRVFGCRDKFNRLYVQPFLAMHFRCWEENNYDVDQNYALGVEWSKLRYVGQKFRIFGEYHNGYCDDGQFVKMRSNYFAIKTQIGF
jgi:hypothetical protein